MSFRIVQHSGKFCSSCTIGGHPRRAYLHEVSRLERSEQVFSIDRIYSASDDNVVISMFIVEYSIEEV
jgi:hypothetical protein